MDKKQTIAALEQRIGALERQAAQRDQSERARRQKETYLSTLIARATDAIFVSTLDGRLLLVNQQACNNLGYSSEALLNMSLHDIDDLHATAENIANVLGLLVPDEVVQFESRYRRKDGSTFPVEVRVSLMEMHNSPAVVGFARDISQRKEAERRLQESELNIHEVFWVTEPRSSKMVYVSPAFDTVWGRPSADLYQNPRLWLDAVFPEDTESVQNNWNDQVNGKNTYEEFRIRRPDGTLRWIANRSYPIKDAEGRIAMVTGVATDITDQKHAQEKFRSLAARWQSTFDAVYNSVCVLDADWTIVQANQATASILNLPMEEIIGRKCFELVHGTREPIEDCPVRRIGQTYQRQSEELQLGGHWVEVIADPILDADGELEGFVHIISNIDERKQAEQALKQSESTLKSIFKAAPTGIGMVVNRVLTQANDRLCEMTGYTREELIGKSARLLYPSDADYEYVGREKYAQITAKGTGTVETRWRHKNGTILDVLLSSTPLNIDNWSAGVTFTALDITERKKTEKALRASHEMFLTVLDGIDATIYVADMQTYEILFMNKFMRQSFGRDFTGQICWQAFRREGKPCAHCTNDRLLDGQGQPAGVYVWQDRNPLTHKWYINYDRAIEWMDGRIVRLQIATDISDMKRLEAQLLQSQKMEAIGNLAGGIAHDFNNILSAVIGYTELSLSDIEPGSALANNLKEILRAGVRAKDLVKHILAFARRSEEQLKPVRVSTVAKEVLKLLRSTLPTSIEIKARIDSDALVMADPTQIHQIFMNLATNAAHAMEENRGTLTLGLGEIGLTDKEAGPALNLAPGRYLKITVSDTGKGIPTQHLESIFEPYFTTKPTGEGTGLGLSVVHGIVKGYGGEIMVSSQQGRRTDFTIFLPVIDTLAENGRPIAAELVGGQERILLVDDEQALCEIGSMILMRLGYQVTTRTSSVEALALFRARPLDFDIVITDMTMPNLTGDKLAAELIRIRPDIPIILCTGYSKIISEDRAAAIGIRAFVMKPMTLEDLSATIRKVLTQTKAPNRA
jgi:PAS domain S-box-containing protein